MEGNIQQGNIQQGNIQQGNNDQKILFWLEEDTQNDLANDMSNENLEAYDGTEGTLVTEKDGAMTSREFLNIDGIKQLKSSIKKLDAGILTEVNGDERKITKKMKDGYLKEIEKLLDGFSDTQIINLIRPYRVVNDHTGAVGTTSFADFCFRVGSKVCKFNVLDCLSDEKINHLLKNNSGFFCENKAHSYWLLWIKHPEKVERYVVKDLIKGGVFSDICKPLHGSDFYLVLRFVAHVDYETYYIKPHVTDILMQKYSDSIEKRKKEFIRDVYEIYFDHKKKFPNSTFVKAFEGGCLFDSLEKYVGDMPFEKYLENLGPEEMKELVNSGLICSIAYFLSLRGTSYIDLLSEKALECLFTNGCNLYRNVKSNVDLDAGFALDNPNEPVDFTKATYLPVSDLDSISSKSLIKFTPKAIDGMAKSKEGLLQALILTTVDFKEYQISLNYLSSETLNHIITKYLFNKDLKLASYESDDFETTSDDSVIFNLLSKLSKEAVDRLDPAALKKINDNLNKEKLTELNVKNKRLFDKLNNLPELTQTNSFNANNSINIGVNENEKEKQEHIQLGDQ